MNVIFWQAKKVQKYCMDLIVASLTPGCRSSSLHAIEVSWMYQSGNKHKHYENQVTNIFMDVSTGKQNIKIMKNIAF